MAAFAFDTKDFDALGAGFLQGNGFAGTYRTAVTAGAGIEFHEEVLLGHLGVAGQAAHITEAQDVFPGQHAIVAATDQVFLVTGLLVHHAQGFVENREGRVDQGHGVAGRQHEPVAKPFFGMPDIPAHGATQQQADEVVGLGATAAGVTALAVVQHQIDLLIDDVLDDLPALKILCLGLKKTGDIGHDGLLSIIWTDRSSGTRRTGTRGAGRNGLLLMECGPHSRRFQGESAVGGQKFWSIRGCGGTLRFILAWI